MQKLILRHGDCVEVLKGYEDGSLGAIISDPPYGLFFMGKAFDDLGEGAAQRKWHEAWLTEAYRVLRPGGVIKAFSGTRTFHHMAYAMAEAGFEGLRIESWNYGSGFPKSHNIALAFDKEARGHPHGGKDPNKRSQSGSLKFEGAALATNRTGDGACGLSKNFNAYTPVADFAQQWTGYGTALKPSWEPVCVGRKPE